MTLIVILGGLVIEASAASATQTPGVNATPYNDGSHWWSSDGCSVVPDSGFHTKNVYVGRPPWGASVPVTASWDFHHACVHHDGCYRNRWASRETC
ncbi:MAG: hypothetical protein ACRD1K_13000, partial [Acidimicrobiales bacterium]